MGVPNVREIPISLADCAIAQWSTIQRLPMLAVVQVVLLVLNILWWIIIVSAILSWLLAFNILDYRNNFVRTVSDTLYRLTEPLYRPIRRILPNLGGLDLSPLVVLIAIFFLQQIIYLYVVPAIYRAGI